MSPSLLNSRTPQPHLSNFAKSRRVIKKKQSSLAGKRNKRDPNTRSIFDSTFITSDPSPLPKRKNIQAAKFSQTSITYSSPTLSQPQRQPPKPNLPLKLTPLHISSLDKDHSPVLSHQLSDSLTFNKNFISIGINKISCNNISKADKANEHKQDFECFGLCLKRGKIRKYCFLFKKGTLLDKVWAFFQNNGVVIMRSGVFLQEATELYNSSFLTRAETDTPRRSSRRRKRSESKYFTELEGQVDPEVPADQVGVPYATYQGLRIEVQDYMRLNPGVYLNDVAVTFGLSHSVCTEFREFRCKVHVFSTFLWDRILVADYASVVRWSKGVDLFAQKVLVVPVIQHMHWSVVVVCDPGDKCSVWALNSLGRGKARDCEVVYDYLEFERHRRGMPSWGIERHVECPKVPQQLNTFDCGVFVVEFVSRFLGEVFKPAGDLKKVNKHWFTQKDVESRRLALKDSLEKLHTTQSPSASSPEPHAAAEVLSLSGDNSESSSIMSSEDTVSIRHLQ